MNKDVLDITVQETTGTAPVVLSPTAKKELARKFCIFERIKKDFNFKKKYTNKIEVFEDEYSSFCKFEYVKVDKENFRCSSRQLLKVIGKYSNPLKELIEEGYLKVLVPGEAMKITTRYEILKEFTVDLTDEVIKLEVTRIRMKEQMAFLKTNKPENFRFIGIGSLASEVLPTENETRSQYHSRLNDYQETINKMQKGELSGHVSVGGRVFSGFTSLPRGLRKYLKIVRTHPVTGVVEYRSVAEIDINATIPRLLGCAIEEIIGSELKNAKRRHLKGKNIHESLLFKLQDGEVVYTDFTLQLLSEVKEYDKLINENDTYLNIIKKLKLSLSRDDINPLMLKLVFGTEFDDSKGNLTYLNLVGKFQAVYPTLYEFIKSSNQKYRDNKNDELRSKNENTITAKIFRIESDILNETSCDLEIDRLTLFDAIYVQIKHKKMVLEKMKEKFEKITGRTYKGKMKKIGGEEEKREEEKVHAIQPTSESFFRSEENSTLEPTSKKSKTPKNHVLKNTNVLKISQVMHMGNLHWRYKGTGKNRMMKNCQKFTEIEFRALITKKFTTGEWK